MQQVISYFRYTYRKQQVALKWSAVLVAHHILCVLLVAQNGWLALVAAELRMWNEVDVANCNFVMNRCQIQKFLWFDQKMTNYLGHNLSHDLSYELSHELSHGL